MLFYSFAKKILDLITGQASSVAVSGGLFLGLSTTTPAADGTNITEPSGNGYARSLLGAYGQALTIKMTVPSAGETTNDEMIFFPEATGSWGTITHVVLYDSTGEKIAFAALTSSITPSSGVVIIRASSFTLTAS